MSKTTYNKKIKNGKEYYFYRLRHKNLSSPKDVYASTVKELDAKLKDLIKELDYGVNNKEIFGNFMKDWLFDVHFTTVKPSTKERYEGIYRNYFENSKLSKMKLKDVIPKNIQEHYNSLVKEGKSVNSINNLHKIIAPCIRYAYNNNMIIKDFTRAIMVPAESEEEKLAKISEVNPFTIEEQKLFLKAIKGHNLEVLFLTALNTGLRIGELLALTWKDFDYENKVVRVDKAIKYVTEVSKENGREKCKLTLQTTKSTSSDRVVPVPDIFIKTMRQHEAKQKSVKFKAGVAYSNLDLIFCTELGKYLDPSNVNKRIKKVLNNITNMEEAKKQNIDVSNKSIHDLRHTYATRLFELKEEPKTVQKLLGHSTLAITMDTYTHVLEELKENAVSKLNDLYKIMGAK